MYKVGGVFGPHFVIHHRMLEQKSRSVLTVPQVLQIFKLKKHSHSGVPTLKSEVTAACVGRQFNVSPKAIRDIWIGRTWYRVTHHLEPTREDTEERLAKRPGRPRGAKDRKPRARTFQKLPILGSQQRRKSERSIQIRTDPFGFMQPVLPLASANTPDSQTLAHILHVYPPLPSHQAVVATPSTGTAPAPGQSFQPAFDDTPAVGLDFGDPFHDDWKHWA